MDIRTIILIIMISGSIMMTISGVRADTIPITYISCADPLGGFDDVDDSTTHRPPPYKKPVLTINQSDTVIWKNCVGQGPELTSFTIVSKEGLFKDAYLRLPNDLFSYTFNQPGNYTFYIKERQAARQIVAVNIVDGYSIPTVIPTTVTTIVPTPIKTPVSTNTISPNKTNITPVPLINSTGNSTGYSIQFPDIKLPIRISMTTIASIIVVIISIIITYKTGKNKR